MSGVFYYNTVDYAAWRICNKILNMLPFQNRLQEYICFCCCHCFQIIYVFMAQTILRRLVWVAVCCGSSNAPLPISCYCLFPVLRKITLHFFYRHSRQLVEMRTLPPITTDNWTALHSGMQICSCGVCSHVFMGV